MKNTNEKTNKERQQQIQFDNQMLQVDLTKCHECKKPFSKGQEYHEVYREGIVCMNVCIGCHKKYTDKKKVWEK